MYKHQKKKLHHYHKKPSTTRKSTHKIHRRTIQFQGQQQRGQQPDQQGHPQQQLNQNGQQQELEIDLNDPNWSRRVDLYHLWLRKKVQPIFQQTFQLLLATKGVIPFPSSPDEYRNPAAHILTGLKKHHIIMDKDETMTLPKELTSDNKEYPAVEQGMRELFQMLTFYNIVPTNDGAESLDQLSLKPGIVNPFIPFTAGTFETDPLNYDHKKIKAKLDANKRLGLNVANNIQTVFDTVQFCFKAAGGADWTEYMNEQYFLRNINNLPPQGDVISLEGEYLGSPSPFNPNSVVCQKELRNEQAFWQQLSQINDVKQLASFFQTVSRQDIIAIWTDSSKENKAIIDKLQNIKLNPLIEQQFTETEKDSLKSIIVQCSIQNNLSHSYLFENYQRYAYNINMMKMGKPQEVEQYMQGHDEAVFGDKIDDWVKMDLDTLTMLDSLSSALPSPLQGERFHIAPRSLPTDLSKVYFQQFLTGLAQTQLIPSPKSEDVIAAKEAAGGDPAKMMKYLSGWFIKQMVEKGILKHLEAGEKNPLEGIKLSIDGPIVKGEDGKDVTVRCYETDILKYLKTFTVLDDTEEYTLTTLTPLEMPQDSDAMKKIKSDIITNKTFPLNDDNLIKPPTEEEIISKMKRGEKIEQYNIPFQHQLLFFCIQTAAKVGDSNPQYSVPDFLTDEELTAVVANGEGRVVDQHDLELTPNLRVRRSIVQPIKTDLPVKIEGWVRCEENDEALKKYAPSIDADLKTATNTDVQKLRQLIAPRYQHDIMIDFALSNKGLFNKITSDMHTIRLTDPELMTVKMLTSQLNTQSQLKAKFRADQKELADGQKPTYHHVLLQTTEQRKASEGYLKTILM